MKKFLLGTTALVSLVASAAYAEAPAVTVGGSIDFQAGMTDQDKEYRTGANSRNGKFANDTNVDIKVNGKADNGLVYGANIRLLADVTSSDDNSGLNADRTYTFIETNAGRLEMGSNVGATKTLKVDASTIARATGGIDGDWYRFANGDLTDVGVASGAAGLIYGMTPDLPSDAGKTERGDRENATKISYYSPRYSGVQLGISYTPDTGNRGTAAAFTSKYDTRDYGNVFGGGVNFERSFNQVAVAASATGEVGQSEDSALEDLGAYALGLQASVANFTVAGSYGNTMKTGQLKGDVDNKNAYYWTLGGAYVQGPVGASVTYLNSNRRDNKFSNVSVGADYQLAPGLVPYAEVSFIKFDPNAAITTSGDNTGTVFLLGTQLNF